MQLPPPHRSRKRGVLNAPVCHTKLMLRITLRFSVGPLPAIKTNANTSVCITRSDAEGKGWRVNYTLFINLTNPLSLCHKHTHPSAFFLRFQVELYHFWKTRSGCCLLLVKPRPPGWLEQLLLWQYLLEAMTACVSQRRLNGKRSGD